MTSFFTRQTLTEAVVPQGADRNDVVVVMQRFLAEIPVDDELIIVDPYFYANAFLPWDAHMTEETNRLLEKGSRYRDWDWMLPFFIGFNDFFFLLCAY